MKMSVLQYIVQVPKLLSNKVEKVMFSSLRNTGIRVHMHIG